MVVGHALVDHRGPQPASSANVASTTLMYGSMDFVAAGRQAVTQAGGRATGTSSRWQSCSAVPGDVGRGRTGVPGCTIGALVLAPFRARQQGFGPPPARWFSRHARVGHHTGIFVIPTGQTRSSRHAVRRTTHSGRRRGLQAVVAPCGRGWIVATVTSPVSHRYALSAARWPATCAAGSSGHQGPEPGTSRFAVDFDVQRSSDPDCPGLSRCTTSSNASSRRGCNGASGLAPAPRLAKPRRRLHACLDLSLRLDHRVPDDTHARRRRRCGLPPRPGISAMAPATTRR